MNILFKTACIIDPTSPHNGKVKDVLVVNGVIKKIADAINKPKDTQEIRLDNLHISPGWFDTSVSFGEPGYEERETIENGLNTAAHSGFTAVAVNPNTFPVGDTKSTIEFMIGKSIGQCTDLYPIGTLTKGAEGLDMAELYDMQSSGAIAFGDYNKAIANGNILKIALLYAQNFDGLVMSFPQNDDIAGPGIVNEGDNSTKLGLKGIPALAEDLQVTRDLFILEYTGGKLHIPTISTEKSVALIRNAKKNGLDVSCSVSAHHLVLTDEELFGFDTRTKVIPPLRTKKDIKALLRGIKDGTIDMITSDHNPIDIEHKKVEYNNAKYGTIGLESLFGAVNGCVDLEKLVACLSHNPRKRFGLEAISLTEGMACNLTLFNPEKSYQFTKDLIRSTSTNSIFIGKALKGTVYGVCANNQLIN
jgi:dihydroorotase